MKPTPLWVKQADDAMIRAAQRAREVAKRTGTSIVVMEDGKIVRLTPSPDGETLLREESPGSTPRQV